MCVRVAKRQEEWDEQNEKDDKREQDKKGTSCDCLCLSFQLFCSYRLFVYERVSKTSLCLMIWFAIAEKSRTRASWTTRTKTKDTRRKTATRESVQTQCARATRTPHMRKSHTHTTHHATTRTPRVTHTLQTQFNIRKAEKNRERKVIKQKNKIEVDGKGGSERRGRANREQGEEAGKKENKWACAPRKCASSVGEAEMKQQIVWMVWGASRVRENEIEVVSEFGDDH